MRRFAAKFAAFLVAMWLAVPAVWGVDSAPAPADDDLQVRLERVFLGAPPAGVSELKAMQDHVKELTNKVLPCTVGVQIRQAWGSGVIISKDGYVLTAAHVAGQANQRAQILLGDGRIVRGKTLGMNRALDAGLIKITDEGEYPHVEMGASKDVKEGQWCMAVGHPGGYVKDRGLVVRLGRVTSPPQSDAITTDCTLVGGDSGGPLLDMQGRVIGINSRISGPISSNIHVPVDAFHNGWDRLVKADVWGHMAGQEPVLGVTGEENVEIAKVARVGRSSAAEKAGIQKGDVIVKFGDTEITNFASLKQAVLDHNPGDKVAVQLQRGEETIDLTVTLARRGE